MRTSPEALIIAAIATLPLLGAPRLCSAWSYPAHKTIAIIAQGRLNAAAAKRVKELLGSASLADISACADQVKRSAIDCGGVMELPMMPQTRQWHYVDVMNTMRASEASVEEACQGNCLLAALRKQVAVLRDPASSKRKQQMALMFVVHLMGDLYQPLHCAEKLKDGDPDAGGNERDFPSFSMNLHHLWDLMIMTNTDGYAVDLEQLAGRLKGGSAGTFSLDDLSQAAAETFAIAKDKIYPEYAKHHGKTAREEYIAEMQPIAHRQVGKAGASLGDLLNFALTNPASAGSAAAGAAASEATHAGLRSVRSALPQAESAPSFDSTP